MKAMLIKLGKVIEAVKRDGFFNGGKKVFKFLFSFFGLMKKLPPGDILFITDGVGDSALYRSHHISEELNLKDFKSYVTISQSPHLLSYADSFKIFVFQKVTYTEKIKKFIEEIKLLNKEIIFDTDDLVFDAKYFKDANYLDNANVFEKKQYEKGIGEEILKDPYVKVCTTTTSFLADKLKECGKQIFVVPNKLSKKDVEIAENILGNKKQEIQSTVKLGYFSGTSSHNKDFATIADALMEIMEKYSQVELFLAGPLDVESKLNKFKDRIKQFPYVSREKHFQNVASVDVNLAPLEIDNPFCQAKSELKFFEAGIVEVPTVASATGTFKEVILDGVDGFVASDAREWFSKLEGLILSPKERFRMGQEARKKALGLYTTEKAKNDGYYDYLRSRL